MVLETLERAAVWPKCHNPGTLVLVFAAIVGTTSCASTDPCEPSNGWRDAHAQPLIHGRITSQRIVMGESISVVDRPLDGIRVRTSSSLIAEVSTDSNGCFVLPVPRSGVYTVIAMLNEEMFLGARGVGVTQRRKGFGQIPPSVDMLLPPLCLLRIPIEPQNDDLEIELVRVANGDIEVWETATIDGSGWASFAGFGPGSYLVRARSSGGETVFYPQAASPDEGQLIEIGFQPVTLPPWSIPELNRSAFADGP